MGTNYYAVTRVTDDLKKKIKNHVNAGEWDLAKKLMPNPIHIGKSSAGWRFAFNHNNWEFFDKSLESLDLFLSVCDLEDEYGSPITKEDFWIMVKNKEDGIDNKEYYTNWDKYNKHFITGEPTSKPNYIPKDFGEEYHFGIRFLTCVEFS